tara:strand:- start:8782 stop:9060 length:279 start_codon:yes stop_codon:yes gene_type:complete
MLTRRLHALRDAVVLTLPAFAGLGCGYYSLGMYLNFFWQETTYLNITPAKFSQLPKLLLEYPKDQQVPLHFQAFDLFIDDRNFLDQQNNFLN